MCIDLRERETSISCHLYTPQPGIKPATSVRVLTRIEPATFWCMRQCSNWLSNRPGGLKFLLKYKSKLGEQLRRQKTGQFATHTRARAHTQNNQYALNDVPIYKMNKITKNLFLLTKYKVFSNPYKTLAFWFPTRNMWDTLAWKQLAESFHRKGQHCSSNLREVNL